MEPRKVLERTLLEAGRLVRRLSGKVGVSWKGRGNPVTEADRRAESLILKRLTHAFPGHGYLSEERLPKAGRSGYTWVIDPLDGTVNYAHGFPVSAVSIALVGPEGPLLGGVCDPFRGELFLAEKGRGASLNGRRIRVSSVSRLEDSLLVTGFPYDRAQRAARYLGFYGDFLKRVHDVRRSGSAALDLAWVAAGRLDGFWEFHLEPWDVAAGRLLVEEAGGTVTGFDGRPWGPLKEYGRRTLASNGRIHLRMLGVIRRRLRG